MEVPILTLEVVAAVAATTDPAAAVKVPVAKVAAVAKVAERILRKKRSRFTSKFCNRSLKCKGTRSS